MTNDPDNAIELRVDKYIFRFPNKLRYSEDGLWVKQEGALLRIGMSDFVQQRSGDIAFAIPTPAGTALDAGDEIAAVETVKVNLSLPSPVKGKIVEVNSLLQESPEWINQEPYGKGWIVVVQPECLGRDVGRLIPAKAYSELARQHAEAELST